MSLKVKTALKQPGIHEVAPIGSIDTAAQALFEDALKPVLQQKPDVLIFNMEYTDYINSAGIRVLLKAKKSLEAHGGKQVFIHMQPQIRKVFDILNALPSLRVFASIQELDLYLDTMQRKTTGQA
jgi:anti-anti-sigma factor